MALVEAVLLDHVDVEVGIGHLALKARVMDRRVYFLHDGPSHKGTGQLAAHAVDPNHEVWRDRYRLTQPLRTGFTQLTHARRYGGVRQVEALHGRIVVVKDLLQTAMIRAEKSILRNDARPHLTLYPIHFR